MLGLCLQWLDGTGARGRKPSGSWRKPLLVPEARSQGRRSRRRWSAGRRCRVPLFPGDPGHTPRLVTNAPFGAPPPLIVRGDTGKPRTLRAARMRKLGCLTSVHYVTIGRAAEIAVAISRGYNLLSR